MGVTLLYVAALFQLSDGLQIVATGILRGAGETRIPMISTLVGHWVLGLPIGYLLGFRWGWGAPGVWAGWVVGLTTVAIALLFVWHWKMAAEPVETDSVVTSGPRDPSACTRRIERTFQRR